MKYTKEQLQGMSKAAIGKQLDILTGMYCEDVSGAFIPTLNIDDSADIMPLAFEHNIGVMPYNIDKESPDYPQYKDFWFAQPDVFDDNFSVDSKNPLRAIACCLILVLQEKQS